MRLRHVSLVGVLATAVVSGATFGASGAASAAGTKTPFEIAATTELTGAIAASGQSYLTGFEIAIDAFNAKGGDHGHKVVIKTFDDGSQAAQGVANTRTALTVTKPLMMCCGVYSAVSITTDPLWQQYQTPGISEGAPPGSLTSASNPGNPYVFVSDLNAGTGEWKQEIAVVTKLAKQKNIAKPAVAIAALATATGTAAAANFTKAAQAKGWTITTTQQVGLTGTGLTGPAAQIVASKPDFVVGTVAGTSEQPFFALLKQDGLTTTPIVDYSSGITAAIYSALNMPNLYGLLSTVFPGGTTAASKKYLALAAKYHLNAQGQLGPNGYAGGLMVAAALKKCGANCTPAKMETALQSLKGFTGTGFFVGPLVLTKSNHDGIQAANLVHWTGQTGSLKPVFRVTGTKVSTS
jgi:ABC-type branched-subunit amino acid transport system substrate-binding protein